MTYVSDQLRDRFEELLALTDGDRDLLNELIDVFLIDAPERLGEVRRALDSQNAAALYRAAHALKGSAGNFGAADVVGRAMRLETLALQPDLNAAAREWTLLEEDMNRLTDELAAARHVA